MNATAVSKSDSRQRRAESASRYAPRPARVAPEPKREVVDMRLRRLTIQALEELKKPGAAPSTVIYAALVQAASGK